MSPDGSLTDVRHAWTFDDMFSTFAVVKFFRVYAPRGTGEPGQRLEIAVCCSGTPGSHFRVG